MQKTLSTLIAIRTSSMANLVVYYLQKLPLVGKRIPDRLYAKLGAKKILSAAAFLLSLLGNFAGKLAFVGLFLYLPVSAVPDLSGDERWTLFLHLFFLTSFVAAGVSAATILEPKREKYVAVKLMRLSPARYMKAALAYRYAAYFVFLCAGPDHFRSGARGWRAGCHPARSGADPVADFHGISSSAAV